MQIGLAEALPGQNASRCVSGFRAAVGLRAIPSIAAWETSSTLNM